jgi:16S rRNA (cytidine1402-2'-O)-methyltransferase
VTKILLERYNIRKPLDSYHAESGERKIEHIINELKSGVKIALVTDAGTPGISDPGNYLIKRILEEYPECKISPIPGPSAMSAALSVCGFHTDRFVFLGFPPHKKGRQTFFKSIGDIEDTVVFYESKHRIERAVKDLREITKIGKRPLIIAREMTKQFESIYRGTLDLVEMKMKKDNLLGEFVIVISNK